MRKWMNGEASVILNVLCYSDDPWGSLRSIRVTGEVMLTNARDACWCLMSAYSLNCCDSNWRLSFRLLRIMMALLMHRNDALCPTLYWLITAIRSIMLTAHLPFKSTLFFEVFSLIVTCVWMSRHEDSQGSDGIHPQELQMLVLVPPCWVIFPPAWNVTI